MCCFKYTRKMHSILTRARKHVKPQGELKLTSHLDPSNSNNQQNRSKALEQHCQQAGPPHKLSEFVILSNTVSVQVPGSVEEERLFSKLALINQEQQAHRLEEEHFNACLTLATQQVWGL